MNSSAAVHACADDTSKENKANVISAQRPFIMSGCHQLSDGRLYVMCTLRVFHCDVKRCTTHVSSCLKQEIRNQASEYPYKVAKLPVNRNLNRYRDVSPCESYDKRGGWWKFWMTSLWFAICVSSPVLVSDDHSRVKLENSENDYINASLVMMEEAQRAYILSQVWCTLSLNNTVWVCTDTIYRRICMKGFTLMFCEVLICVSSAFTGAFEKHLWSFLANGLGAVFQSCYYAQQSYWKGICKYDSHHIFIF